MTESVVRTPVRREVGRAKSALGDAIGYLLKHWDALTLFLTKPRAPLDKNVCERALKKAILHRKNVLLTRPVRGARVGDIYTTLIYTCELNGINAFDYLHQLQLHAADVARQPDHRDALELPRRGRRHGRTSGRCTAKGFRNGLPGSARSPVEFVDHSLPKRSTNLSTSPHSDAGPPR